MFLLGKAEASDGEAHDDRLDTSIMSNALHLASAVADVLVLCVHST